MAGTIAAREDRIRAFSRRSHSLNVERFLQPDETTCGPACLRKGYALFGLHDTVDDNIHALERKTQPPLASFGEMEQLLYEGSNDSERWCVMSSMRGFSRLPCILV